MNDTMLKDAAEKRLWDVLIIGSGVGGGTATYGFSRLGKSVLLVERGRSRHADNGKVVNGHRAEMPTPPVDTESDEQLKRIGLFWDVLYDVSQREVRPFRPLLGSSVGGSSSIYGMAMERFRPEDFAPGQFFLSVEGANIPQTWPICYSDLQQYYAEAEGLYRVHGTPDPIGPQTASYDYLQPPPLSSRNLEIMQVLTKNGLHPYRQPMACEYFAGCRECSASICPRGCRNDSYTRCIVPAIQDFGAQVIDDCEAVYIEADESKVTGVRCIHHGEPLLLRAKTVVLSAGALQTAVLLIKSKSPVWPNGLANHHDHVGRNLMRHLVDFYLVRTTNPEQPGELTKQISFNDYYVTSGSKLGTVQSLGPMPSVEDATKLLAENLGQTFPSVSLVLNLALPALRALFASVMNRSLMYASILEDLPYAANRVTYDETRSHICISYRVHEEARSRLRKFRSLCRDAFSPLLVHTLRSAHNSRLLSHQAGTCRFGNTPQDSVLDRYCRAHELDNLLVVDGSFMPTSGGVNPSLTIAANALRVCAQIN